MKDFKAEVFFEEFEFSSEYLLTSSDAESMSIRELLSFEPMASEEFLDVWMGYTEVPGNPELRKEIAKLYETMDESDVIVHAGAEEAIFNFMRTFVGSGDHAIVMFPAYQSLYEVAEANGCEVSKWQLKEDGLHWKADLQELEALIKSNTKVICINSPHNPTGFLFSQEELNKIVEIAQKNNLLIFSDEVYKGIEFDKRIRNSICDMYEKSLSLGVMSKSFGFAGLRIGWIATKNMAIKNGMKKAKHYTTVCSSAPAEYLSLLALRHKKEIIERNRAILDRNLKIAQRFFSKHEDIFEYRPPMGGTVAYVKMNIEQNIHDFCIDLVKKKGVLLLSSDIFDMNGQYFRMGFGRKNFEACLNKFEEYLIEKKITSDKE
ncbi:MAG: aminotransferase class I/II-fold pyridoxal phosphate-dependent enzyme [Eubacteriales bacterium]